MYKGGKWQPKSIFVVVGIVDTVTVKGVLAETLIWHLCQLLTPSGSQELSKTPLSLEMDLTTGGKEDDFDMTSLQASNSHYYKSYAYQHRHQSDASIPDVNEDLNKLGTSLHPYT
eukprot:1120471-Ditylum_brightwellii.AAC.1